LSIDRYRTARFNDAVDEFRATLHPAKLYMQSEKGKRISMPSEWIEQHDIAALEFRNHLSRRQRCAFDSDWREYRTQESKKEPYPYQAGDPLPYEDPALVLKCIDAVLTHARSK
jgi:hypothetical protein